MTNVGPEIRLMWFIYSDFNHFALRAEAAKAGMEENYNDLLIGCQEQNFDKVILNFALLEKVGGFGEEKEYHTLLARAVALKAA